MSFEFVCEADDWRAMRAEEGFERHFFAAASRHSTFKHRCLRAFLDEWLAESASPFVFDCYAGCGGYWDEDSAALVRVGTFPISLDAALAARVPLARVFAAERLVAHHRVLSKLVAARVAWRGGGDGGAEWLAANTGGVHRNRVKSQVPPVSVLRKTSSIEQKSQIAKGGTLQIADAVGLLGGGSGLNPEADGPSSLRRKVSFREEGEIESTKLYAPTPTKRNPQGVGQTSAKYAPFAARGDGGGVPGTINELNDPDFDEAPAGQFGSFSQQRALRQAAGRWVIPPQELKLGRRIGSGSFGVVIRILTAQ